MLFSNPISDFKQIRGNKGQKLWEPFLKKYRCNNVCELGVFKGNNFLEMIKHKPKVAVAVDNWQNAGVHTPQDAKYTHEELKAQYRFFASSVKDFPFVQIIRDSTINASKKFPDNYFDFIYVDADASTKGYYQDLIAWYPKVKRGKFLVGHNYKKGFGVVDAVNRFTKENKLELAYLPASNWMVVKA